MTLPKLTALALITLATPALSDSHGAAAPGAHFIENWDLDGDGSVTLAEATQKRAEVFTMFDQDEDGQLNSSEYDLFDVTRQADMQANAGGHGKGPMKKINQGLMRDYNDTNGDGAVSAAEFADKTAAWFAGIDRNSDGRLTPADFIPAKP